MLKVCALRSWVELMTAVRWHAWRYLPLFAKRLGPEGRIIALELSEGEAACNILRAGGAKVGDKVRVCRGLTVHNADDGFANALIGNQCHLGRQVFLDLADQINIGDRVTISMRTIILTHTSIGDSQSYAGRQAQKRLPVRIEDDVYVGAGVIVLPGVTIGKGAIIGAGTVVTKSVQAGATIVGASARDI